MYASQIGDLKKQLGAALEREEKMTKRHSRLKQRLETTEEQLEQVSEVFDDMSEQKEEEEGKISALVASQKELEASEAVAVEENDELKSKVAELEDRVAQLSATQIPSSLYKQRGESVFSAVPEPQKEDDAEKWKTEAAVWRKKCDGMGKDLKKLLKSTVNAKEVEQLKKDLSYNVEELVAHKKALEHTLLQLDEMRLREMVLLGQTFDKAPAPKSKRYVAVARNIVKMRKATASKTKKVVRRIVNNTEKTVTMVNASVRRASKGMNKSGTRNRGGQKDEVTVDFDAAMDDVPEGAGEEGFFDDDESEEGEEEEEGGGEDEGENYVAEDEERKERGIEWEKP